MNYIKKFLIIIILIQCSSCTNNELKSKILEAYESSSNLNNDSLDIHKLEILKVRKVGSAYRDSITINTNNFIANSEIKKLDLIDKKAELIRKNIKNYQKLLDIGKKENFEEYNNQIVVSGHNLVELMNDSLQIENHLKILGSKNKKIRLDNNNSNSKFLTLVEYYLKAENANTEINDTLQILFNKDYIHVFIKDSIASEYNGR